MSFFDYAALCEALEQLYRSFGVLPRVLGRSALGRAVFALDLGAKQNRSLLLGGLGGNEGAQCALMLRFLKMLLGAARDGVLFCGVDAKRVLAEAGVCVVCCLNPDGLALCSRGLEAAGPLRRFLRPLLQPEIPWQANARGVDLRLQFPSGFDAARDLSTAHGQTSPGPRGFPGVAPCSETEARALCRLCRNETFRSAIAIQAGEPALLWCSGRADSEKAPLCAKLLSQEAALPLLPDSGGAGTFPRWFSETTGRSVFTVQTGKGNDPLPEADLFSCLMLGILL